MTRLGLDVALKVFALASICTSISLFTHKFILGEACGKTPLLKPSHPLSSSHVGKAEQAFLPYVHLIVSLTHLLPGEAFHGRHPFGPSLAA